jgi:hypothetical protein
MKIQENIPATEIQLCQTLNQLLTRGRDLLRAGKIDGYYALLPEIDTVITELAVRTKTWRKGKKLSLGATWKHEFLENFKELKEAAFESERLAERSVEVTFNGLMQLSQALTPQPTYSPHKKATPSRHAIILDQQV